MEVTPPNFPKQQLPDSKKTPEWFTECHRWLENRLLLNYTGLRSRTKARRNRQFYTWGIMEKEEVARILSPNQLFGDDIPNNFKNYPITNSHIMGLKGEELKRRFDWGVVVTSRDAITQKEQAKKKYVDEFVIKTLTMDAQSDDEVKQLTEDFLEDLHTWQDLRESGASELLTYYFSYLDLKINFAQSWEQELIEGKSLFNVDVHNNKPIVEALDPTRTYYLASGISPFVEDCDGVVIEQFLPISVVKDRYMEYLDKEALEYLDKRFDYQMTAPLVSPDAYYNKVVTEGGGITFAPSNDQISSDELRYDNFKGYFDISGNVRVIQTRWIGERKVAFLSYFDENGDPQETTVPAEYKPDPLKGETVRIKWINEAYESTRIGHDIFLKQQVKDIQYRKLDARGYCNLGVVGIEYDKCIFDIMKRYQILYNAYMWRLEEAFQKSLGEIAVIDINLIPEGWDVEKTMYYATKLGFIFTDSFKESQRPNSRGKYVGNQGNSQKSVNIQQYEYIQSCFKMLDYCEMQLNKVVGISPERQGLTQSADTGLGVTQERLQASSNITEYYFYNHDQLRLKVLRMLLENAKFCIRNKAESLQYVASDASIITFQLDGEFINEAEYNVMVLSSNIDAKTEQMLQEGIKIGFQTGQVDLEQMLDVYSNDSISSIRRKIKKSIIKNRKLKEQESQAERDHVLQVEQLRLQDKQEDRLLTKYKIDEDNRTKINVASINVYSRQEDLDQNNDGVVDPLELAANALKEQELSQKLYEIDKNDIVKHKDIDNKHKVETKKLDLEREKLKIEREKLQVEKSNQANDLAIARLNKAGRTKSK